MTDTAEMILFAPYDRERYVVDERIRQSLTEDEFFTKCYVDFDLEQELKKINTTEAVDFEDEELNLSGDIVKRNQLNYLEQLGDNVDNFYRWIDNNGESIFCIKGDAGVGKTSFLHYLKYMYGDEQFAWEIIDIQKARARVSILKGYQYIDIDHIRNLESMVISMMIDCITDCIFQTNAGIECDDAVILGSFRKFIAAYNERVKSESFLSDFVRGFFECKSLKTSETIAEMRAFAKHIRKKIEKIIRKRGNRTTQIIYDLWEIYEFALKVCHPKKKCIICFDNFERFIGSEEIWNRQLWDFIEDIRHLIQNRIGVDGDFHKHFQFIMFMRNTTTRMANRPLQSIGFGRNELDISDLFPIEDVIKRKLDWYSEHGFDVKDKELVEMILGYGSFDGFGHRSLRTKLCRLFNNNKRYLLRFMTKCIKRTNNIYFKEFSEFANNSRQLNRSLNLYAGRTIIMRMFLDELVNDSFFKNLFVTDETDKQKRLGIARKILIVLKEYSFVNGTKYMPFDEFIAQYVGTSDSIKRFFSDNWQSRRSRMAAILFYMNYYSEDKMDWTHFVDIQYNAGSTDSIHITNYNDLENLICERHDKIGLRIMQGGDAYLEFIVPSFEYFACRALTKKIGEFFPPLFALLPDRTRMENDTGRASDYSCIKMVSRVLHDVVVCVEKLYEDPDTDRLIFRRTRYDIQSRTQIERIVDVHTGYIGNFIRYIKVVYGNDNSIKIVKRSQDLQDTLHRYINLYDKLRTEEGMRWLKRQKY